MNRRKSACMPLPIGFVIVLSLVCNLAVAETVTRPPAGAPTNQPAALVKGPYLQAPRTDGLVICLEPSRDTAGKILVTDPDGKQVLDKPFEAAAGRIARIDLAGLKPYTTYSYRVVLAGSTESIAQATLTTLPMPGQMPVTLLATGDSRSNPRTFKAICDALLKTHIPLFVHSGDFVDAGRQLDLWNPQFFQPAHELMASAVILPVVGNHELSGTGPDACKVFSNFFVLPGNRTYYSLDYGGVHLIILDSCRKDFEGSDQYKWLVQDLAACKAPWKIAVFHHPWFDPGYHANNLDMRHLYDRLFVQYGVDLLVVGHDHNYQRTRPIVHVFDPVSAKPYWQVVSGGAGAPLHPILISDILVETCATTNHFVTLTADKDRLLVVATALTGRELDRFEIRKDKAPEHAVPFEQVELEEALNNWLASHPFRFAPGDPAASMTCTWVNPYPVPVKLHFTASDSERWELTSDPTEIEVGPRFERRPAAKDIRLTLRRLGPSATLDDRFVGMDATYQASKIGSRTLRSIRVPVTVAKANHAEIGLATPGDSLSSRILTPAGLATGLIEGSSPVQP